MTLWTVAPLSMRFPRQEYWSGVPFPTSGDLPDPGIKPKLLASPTLAGGFFTSSITPIGCELVYDNKILTVVSAYGKGFVGRSGELPLLEGRFYFQHFPGEFHE